LFGGFQDVILLDGAGKPYGRLDAGGVHWVSHNGTEGMDGHIEGKMPAQDVPKLGTGLSPASLAEGATGCAVIARPIIGPGCKIEGS